MTAKESWNRESNANFGTVFKIITASVFKVASRNFLVIFVLHKTAYKFQNNFRIYRKYWFNLIGLKKYSFGDGVPIYDRQNLWNSFNVNGRRFSTGFSNSQLITTQQTTYDTQEYTVLMHNVCDSPFASTTQYHFPYAIPARNLISIETSQEAKNYHSLTALYICLFEVRNRNTYSRDGLPLISKALNICSQTLYYRHWG
jgi:hypothetical protein